jgi:hypothetical protein
VSQLEAKWTAMAADTPSTIEASTIQKSFKAVRGFSIVIFQKHFAFGNGR